MIFRTPAYYKKFVCIADKCADNCCFGGWQIDIDDETIEKYKNTGGNFGEKLKKYVDTENACFKLCDGKCPFLMSDNLCEIYRELGEESMGVVCAQFPRFTEYYGDIKETGIGLACEEAARIILCTDYNSDLDASDIDEDEVWGEYDGKLGKPLFLLRHKLTALIDTEKNSCKISDVLLVILDAFSTLQEMINENDYSGVEEYCKNFPGCETDYKIPAAKLKNDNDCKKMPLSASELHEMFKSVWYSYLDLEPLNSYWESLSSAAFEALYDKNGEYFTNLNDKKLADANVKLIKYYLFRYMMKAAFDHDLLGKAQLIIANLIIIDDLTEYKLQNQSETNEADNTFYAAFMDIIHIFSRQIEYSEDNILELYDSFIFDEVFSINSLKKLLS